MLKLEVPYISQKGDYPTGCESVSAVMLLRFLGINIPVSDFIDTCIAKKELSVVGGTLIGADPREYFVGSPYDEESFGCYAPVICKALEKALQKYGLQEHYIVIDETGVSLDQLSKKYIDHGFPVLTWTCINMRNPIQGPVWKLDNGEDFTWISNEHCMLFSGYDEDCYIFHDPFDGNGVVRHEKDLCVSRYVAQHSQAVGVLPCK